MRLRLCFACAAYEELWPADVNAYATIDGQGGEQKRIDKIKAPQSALIGNIPSQNTNCNNGP